jgi:hypothetical protein
VNKTGVKAPDVSGRRSLAQPGAGKDKLLETGLLVVLRPVNSQEIKENKND